MVSMFDAAKFVESREQETDAVLSMQRTDANGVVDTAAAAAHGFVR
jgi:hypothetical protein